MELRIEAMAPKMEETKEESDSVREGIVCCFQLLSLAFLCVYRIGCIIDSLCLKERCRVQRVWGPTYSTKPVAQI